ncbi:nucleoporin subcomplex protein binding to Pom34-domain-containing protein [Crucibulum laeve]|uniref:Nucleoporin NUP188 n=1 Tax=Crucibulum laeve TaxID=68775 RepID=A0A5C3MEY4_9AGAR|nr:nucleoporin subcomplex protein binding to Pom34-domain-containing protein [Crucibulum laeve]
MSGESSKRSNLIDVTYAKVHNILSERQEGVNASQIKEDYLIPRKEQLGNISEPFGKPSDASRKKIEGGSVTLPDGVVVRVENADKEFIYALSSKFQIDQVQALILLRSFFYNNGLPTSAESDSSVVVAELVKAITPFYQSERLSIYRCLIPLFRARENVDDFLYPVAVDFLPQLIPDGPKFAESLITEYQRKTTEKLPESMATDPYIASEWAKQNYKEQLLLLEVLFWTMWGYVPCAGPMVVSIYEAMYATDLGRKQQNDRLLLDAESNHLKNDCMALWMLICVEILELENMGEDELVEISDNPARKDIYLASPSSLRRLHEMVTAHATSDYMCVYTAWTYVISRLSAKIGDGKDVPPSYQQFFSSLAPLALSSSYSKDRQAVHTQMINTCLDPNNGLLELLHGLLTASPLFVTSAAWTTGSTVTDPNAIAFRSVLKGLIIAITELRPIELLDNFDGLIEVWIALFGRSQVSSISGICAQFWAADWQHGIARRAIFDVTRSRFPIQLRPLIRLLRAMTGAGFLDTDPLATSRHGEADDVLSPERQTCDTFVFHYFQTLSTFSQVISISACSGPHALYERAQERYHSSIGPAGLTYINLRPIRLPGGSILPARSPGRLLSGDGGDQIVVCWKHEHSGWKVILELLTDYVNRKRLSYGSGGGYQDVNFNRGTSDELLTLGLEEVGVDSSDIGDEGVITDALDLVRSLIHNNPVAAEDLMQALEGGEPVVAHKMTDAQPPDLVELTTMILEETLSRSHERAHAESRSKLITSAMSVLSALLALPKYSHRVWLYIRSTSALFGSDKTAGFASAALATERAGGRYTMTLALLHLVQRLFREAAFSILPNPKLQQVKEEVMLRATRFVHTEIWVEYLGWKYTHIADRFEIGKRITSFYADILEHCPPALEDRPFPTLSQSIAGVLLFKATTSTINPLVASIASGNQLLNALISARRNGDVRRLIFLLESHLRLVRLVLHNRQQLLPPSKHSLLEQSLCARVIGGASAHEDVRSKSDPIDVLATYVKERTIGPLAPIEAMRVLYALCYSLSVSQPSAPTIIGHLSNPEATVAALVRIARHPYDELTLRYTIWNFMALAVDREPALANLFVTGQFRAPSEVLEGRKEGSSNVTPQTALSVARDMLSSWDQIWESNPQLLACIFKFLDAVWQHGLEHKATLESVRNDSQFWDVIVGAACEEVGPVPDYETVSYVQQDNIRRSSLQEPVAMHSYRTIVKSYAVHIIGLDIEMHVQLNGSDKKPAMKPQSFLKMESHLKSQEQFTDLLAEVFPSSYAPQLHDQLIEVLKLSFEGLTLEQLRSQEPVAEREYGDDFSFSVDRLRSRLYAYPVGADDMVDVKDEVEKQLLSINLNLSLTDAQTRLGSSWEFLLRQVSTYLRGDATVRPILLSIAASMSYDIAGEQRAGDMMATIHGTRLSLLLAILEVAWFSSSDKAEEIHSFAELVKNVRGIILNEAQSPAKSFLGTITFPFHRVLLQLLYFCARHSRSLVGRPNALKSEQRLMISALTEASLHLVVDALRVVFVAARSRSDLDLDRDMQLLVVVFEQCTHKDLTHSPTVWLTRCQETDVMRASLDLYTHIDLVGLTDLPLLLARKQPLYAPHILLFHMAIVSNSTAAERFAGEGVLAAYSNNFISSAISSGQIDVTIPELPVERSPAHFVYCSMLSVVAAVIFALGRHNHYFDAEACGFVQLYGDQITRALSWTINDTITMPLLEEIEQVVNLFYAIACSAPSAANSNPVVNNVLRGFTTRALQLLQQLNYAITHPNHLASLFEPVTSEERILVEKGHPSGDPLQRPLITPILHRMFRISCNIVGTLVAITRADDILLTSPDEWPIHEALVVPHSKILLGEPASLGTLLELGNNTLDVLRDLTNRPTGQSLTQISTVVQPSHLTLDVRTAMVTARQNLEELLLYAVTQLAMWLSKPEFDGSTADIDQEDHSMEMQVQRGDVSKERKVTRPATSLAETLRRRMTGGMATDLQALLTKAKPMIAKTDTVLGSKSVDLTQILTNFLHDRISGLA